MINNLIDHTTFEEYLSFWSLETKNLKLKIPKELGNNYNNFTNIVTIFPHLNIFLYLKPRREANRIKRDKTFGVSLLTPPNVVFLNYIIQIEKKQPTPLQLSLFRLLFGSFTKLDKYLPYDGWLTLEQFCFLKSEVSLKALRDLPVDTFMKPKYKKKSIQLFKYFYFFNTDSGLYETKKMVNQNIIYFWNQNVFEWFDEHKLINHEDSIISKLFLGSNKRVYLNLTSQIDKVFRLSKKA